MAAVVAETTLGRGLNLVLLCGEKSLVLVRCVVVVAEAASTAAPPAISLLSSESTSAAGAAAVTLGLDCGLLNLLLLMMGLRVVVVVVEVTPASEMVGRVSRSRLMTSWGGGIHK